MAKAVRELSEVVVERGAPISNTVERAVQLPLDGPRGSDINSGHHCAVPFPSTLMLRGE
jgi:hypothetical protein